MVTHTDEDLGPYITRLQELPFVQGVRIVRLAPQGGRDGWDALLEIRTDGRTHRLLVEHKRTPRLDYALVDVLLRRRAAQDAEGWVLFAPHVTPPMTAHLVRQGVNFVDLAGNCYLAIDDGHIALIEGRRPARGGEEARVVGRAGFQVMFAILARPGLLNEPVREIALKAGVGKTATALALQRLEQAGLIVRLRRKLILARPKELQERWLAGYHDILRPRNLVGHYRTQDVTTDELEDRIEVELARERWVPPADRDENTGTRAGGRRWGWGGATAAYRLTKHYRGVVTVLHIDPPPVDLVRRLRILPARAGNLTILRAPGPLAYEGTPERTVHPLLVYTELLAADDDRAREAAMEVRERFLGYLG